MKFVCGWFVAGVVVILAMTTVWVKGQTTEKAVTSKEHDSGNNDTQEAEPDVTRADNKFIEPTTLDTDVDMFKLNQLEYLVVNRKRKFRFAKLECKIDYGGQLAIIDTVEKAKFMAEALSETNLEFDALWIGGQATHQYNWTWLDGPRPIDPNLVQNFSTTGVNATDRNCLAFARNTHDVPNYRALACNAERAIMCERPQGGGGGNTTHVGWIRIGRRLFKIFSEKVTYETAVSRCYRVDPDAQLAVIPSYSIACKLNRYLLIGRPSLENAWIGARWSDSDHMYRYEPEPEIILYNRTLDWPFMFPPWRNNHTQKVGGCLLLDRHTRDHTYFIEARCHRERPYICYKFAQNETQSENSTDVIVGNDGYRLHFMRKTWAQSRDYCETVYKDYGAYLTEILVPQDKFNLVYVMGENRSAVQHIWLGGKFEMGKWKWVYSGKEIPVGENAVLNWVVNDTYTSGVESENNCLNMDRENHIGPLHYGTSCKALQYFVCYFTAEQLRQLKEDEKRKQMESEAGFSVPPPPDDQKATD